MGSRGISIDLKCIICHMLEFAKRWGPQFLIAFAALAVGSVSIPIWLHGKWQGVISILLGSFSFICLVATIIALIYDIKDALRGDKEKKRKADHDALVDSFMRMGMTKEKAEIAAKGR